MDAAREMIATTDNWQGYCRTCGYLLRGLQTSRCPECGKTFDRADPRTFRKKPKRPLKTWAQRAAVLLLLLATTYAAEIGWLYWGWKIEQPAVAVGKSHGGVRTAAIGPTWLCKTLRPSDRWLLERVAAIDLQTATTSDDDLAAVGQLHHLETLAISSPHVTDQGLAHLAGLRQVRILLLHSTRITDSGLVHLRNMRKLIFLSLSDTSVTGSGLVNLQGISTLSAVDLCNTPLAPEFLRELRALPALQQLSLEITSTDDAALVHLEMLSQLNSLSLVSTKISDRGLKVLTRMKGLKMLHLDLNAVSPQAVTELRTALPQTTVDADNLLPVHFDLDAAQ
ncbi:MAG TPA: hypothetical protein VIL86_11345 [Tepidisphaeraceae bacterium]|jgi:hypothetical protein